MRKRITAEEQLTDGPNISQTAEIKRTPSEFETESPKSFFFRKRPRIMLTGKRFQHLRNEEQNVPKQKNSFSRLKSSFHECDTITKKKTLNKQGNWKGEKTKLVVPHHKGKKGGEKKQNMGRVVSTSDSGWAHPRPLAKATIQTRQLYRTLI